MDRLVYQHEGRQFEIRLGDEPVSVGRSGEADHRLPTQSASRIHAQFFKRDSGWWVEDLQSSNGTLVNGKRISAPVALSSGDAISVGAFKLSFEGSEAKGPPQDRIARVLYQPGEGKPPVEVVIRDRVTIGRKASNSLQIDSKAVSGQHCEVVNRDGVYVLRDLKSSNGTFIDGKRVTEHTLKNGQTILVGKTAQVFFINPAANEDEQSDSQEPSPSEPGVFEPVRLPPPLPKAANPLRGLAAGLLIGGLLALAGWLIGDVLVEMRTPRTAPTEAHKPETPLADAAFSFEGEIDSRGSPDGWSARIETQNGANAELLSDPDQPFDGRRSLRVSAAGRATIVLDARKARPIDLGGECRIALHVKAQGAQRLSLALGVLGETGEPLTLAAGSFTGLSPTGWSRLEFSGAVPGALPANGHYRLIVCGSFARLWIDRLEISGTGDKPVEPPFGRVEGGEIKLSADARNPARAILSIRQSSAIITPLLMAGDNEVISELDLWATRRVHGRGAEYTALLPRVSDAAQMAVQAEGIDANLFEARGVSVHWSLREGGSAQSLAVEIDLPLPPGETLLVADRRGAPIAVNRDELHSYAYATVSELMVNNTDIAISFPGGVVVWFDLSRSGRLVVTARAALDNARRELRINVFEKPMMFARLYQRLYDEAMRMWATEHGSAAKARLEYLTNPNRPHRELAVIDKARLELERLEEARQELLRQLEDAWARAESARMPDSVASAERAFLRYRRAWPGEAATAEMDDRARQLRIWNAEIESRELTPEEQLQAEAWARSLWADAQKSHEAGHTLMALMLLDNLVRDYAGTSVYRSALVLQERIHEQLSNAEERDRVIDEALARTDEDIKFSEFARARARCLELFKRFPDTPRNREIMQRLRQIENAFEG